MQLPPYLKPGDRVHLISTARKVDPQAIQQARQLFESWGLQVSFGDHLFASEHQFAGSDEARLADLQKALDDPAIQAIFCAKGGYGTTRLLDRLLWTSFLQHPKWVCGFSDVTALLCLLANKGVASVHSSMPGQFDGKPERVRSFESLRQLIFGEPWKLQAPPHTFNRLGEASGKLIGGNLSILVHSIGTPSDPNYNGSILFLEDLDEYLYHTDRMLVQLKRSGKLAKLAGLVIGQFSDMRDNTVPFGKTAYEIIQEHVAEYSFPLGFGFALGHEVYNPAVPVGVNSMLRVREEGAELYES